MSPPIRGCPLRGPPVPRLWAWRRKRRGANPDVHNGYAVGVARAVFGTNGGDSWRRVIARAAAISRKCCAGIQDQSGWRDGFHPQPNGNCCATPALGAPSCTWLHMIESLWGGVRDGTATAPHVAGLAPRTPVAARGRVSAPKGPAGPFRRLCGHVDAQRPRPEGLGTRAGARRGTVTVAHGARRVRPTHATCRTVRGQGSRLPNRQQTNRQNRWAFDVQGEGATLRPRPRCRRPRLETDTQALTHGTSTASKQRTRRPHP